MKKVALVIGGTGLVGKNLVQALIKDNYYNEIILLCRDPLYKIQDTSKKHKDVTLTIMPIDFGNIQGELVNIRVEDIYCCIGTTIKKAGGQKEFKRVDFEIPFIIGNLLIKTGGKRFFLISSIYANTKSNSFYLRVKGELEDKLASLNFDSLLVLRPSVLDGGREEFRLAEEMAIKLGRLFVGLPVLDKFTPTKVSSIVDCLIKKRDSNNSKFEILESKEIRRIAHEN
jgi:uncharacterized protein YbjT (DUF2867 family)